MAHGEDSLHPSSPDGQSGALELLEETVCMDHSGAMLVRTQCLGVFALGSLQCNGAGGSSARPPLPVNADGYTKGSMTSV